jgi:hypothetical protein
VHGSFSCTELGDPTLKRASDLISKASKVAITLDPTAPRLAGLTPEMNVPLTVAGKVSTRSTIHLVPDAFGLDVETTNQGLAVMRRRVSSSWSWLQSRTEDACTRRIEGRLKTKTRFRFDRAPLEEVVRCFEPQTISPLMHLASFSRVMPFLMQNRLGS